MAEKTAISWCDATANFWIGCTKVGPGCANCYAETLVVNRMRLPWGSGAPRKRTSGAWRDLPHWNRKPQSLIGDEWPARRPRVFTMSLADALDNEIPPEWRSDYFATVKPCDNLDILLVTKRIGNAKKMLPPDWNGGYPNVVLIATVVNQEEADRDIPKLLDTPARRYGLSIEPMLGRIELREAWLERLNWVICGGESGTGARMMMPSWARYLKSQCAAAGVPFHFKQVGSNHDGWEGITGAGKDPAQWPEDLQIQEFYI